MGKGIDWFDAYVGLGIANRPPARFSATAAELLDELGFCGVSEALVYHVAAIEEAAQSGNNLVAGAVREHPQLHPLWAVLPPQTGEMGTVHDLFGAMRDNGVRALVAYPESHRYLLDSLTMGSLFEQMIPRRIPLIVPLLADSLWATLAAVMRDFADLTVIVVEHGGWGDDRFFRPFLERYPRLYVDTSRYHQDMGITDIVREYGAGRLLYASGYPTTQMGAALLAVAHAEISEADKALIAGGNLRRILSEVEL